MRDGFYSRGNCRPLSENGQEYKGKPSVLKHAWWTVSMAACMGAMLIAGAMRFGRMRTD